MTSTFRWLTNIVTLLGFTFVQATRNNNDSGIAHINEDLFLCINNGVFINAEWKCDGQNDCGNWDDECTDCEDPQSTLCMMQACVISNQKIRRRQMCDGHFDCEDLSDECLCFQKTEENVNTFEMCQKLFESQVVNVQSQTTNGSTPTVEITCAVGSIPCPGDTDYENRCVTGNFLCDGQNDCSNGVDERFCNRRPALSSTHSKYGRNACDNPIEIRDINGSTKAACKCDGKVELPYGDDEKNCSVHHYCLKDEKTDVQETNFIDWRQKFDGRADCDDISDEWYSNSVYCTDDELTLVKGSRCHERGKNFVASARYAMRNRFFASAEWAIGIFIVVSNTFVAVLTSKFLIRSLIKMCLCGSCSVRQIRTKVIHNIMVLNLCMSDLSLGFGILTITSFDAFVKGRYWQYAQTWQTGALCSVIGSLCILSVQVGASTTFLISGVRLHSVLRPFRSIEIKFVLVLVGLVWTFAIVQMVIPIQSWIRSTEIHFTSAVDLPTFPQVDATILEREKLEILMEKILVLNSLHGVEKSTLTHELKRMQWTELESLMISINPKFGEWRYFGYYSHSSMCLPPVIVSANDDGWSYCVALLLLDFCQYSFVLVAYVIVYRKTKTKPDCKNRVTEMSREFGEACELQQSMPKRKRTQREKEDIDMHRRIFCLVATNFICWMPLIILTLINTFFPNSGVKTIVTLALSMTMVQVNSMINPLLYSKMIRTFVWRFFTWCFENSPRKKDDPVFSQVVHLSSARHKPYSNANRAEFSDGNVETELMEITE